MKASPSAVRKLRPFGWADFKHRLYRAGVIASPVSEVPEDWKAAFCKAFGRDLKPTPRSTP